MKALVTTALRVGRQRAPAAAAARVARPFTTSRAAAAASPPPPGAGAVASAVLRTAANDDAGLTKSPITDALWRQRRSERELHEAAGDDVAALPPQTELLAKAPADSEVRVLYPFASDPALRNRYSNSFGALDKGLLWEDLDALAGNVSWRHAVLGIGTHVRPPLLVTASVDEVRMRGSLRTDGARDMYLKGRVVFVGSSSMLVRCQVGYAATPAAAAVAAPADDAAAAAHGAAGRAAAAAGEDGAPLLVADFLYVARDRATGRASKVNTLAVSRGSADDQALYAEKLADANAAKRAKKREASDKLAAADELLATAQALVGESQALLRMPALGARLPHLGVLVKDTELQNTLVCQPQQRNTSGRIFGGFLMRRAYELALCAAYCFAGQAPRFLWSDQITFKQPVSIGDVLRLDARVILAEPSRSQPRVHCEVFASVLKPEAGTSVLSNRFAFSFSVDPPGRPSARVLAGAAAGAPAAGAVAETALPLVRPSTTSEALRQLEVLKASAHVPDWDQ